jgi:hypothetical protein
VPRCGGLQELAGEEAIQINFIGDMTARAGMCGNRNRATAGVEIVICSGQRVAFKCLFASISWWVLVLRPLGTAQGFGARPDPQSRTCRDSKDRAGQRCSTHVHRGFLFQRRSYLRRKHVATRQSCETFSPHSHSLPRRLWRMLRANQFARQIRCRSRS